MAKLNRSTTLQADDIEVVNRIMAGAREIPAHSDLLRAGDPQHECFVVLDGWACCYKTLEDGRRQIINFAVPGDFAGVRSRSLRSIDYSTGTISAALIAPISVQHYADIVGSMPLLGNYFQWSAARDEAIIVEHLVNLGRRTAIERVASLLLELADRLRYLGLARDHTYVCPLTQEHLADASGLTAIHVNRVLRVLRERKLVDLSRGTLRILDEAGLTDLASYDNSYLDHDSGP